MTLENETFELELIAKAFQAISKEISYGGLARALLEAALGYSGAVRGAVLLSKEGELLAKADASFPRERAKVFTSQPPVDELRLPADLNERVLTRQEIVVRHDSWKRSALIDPAECPAGRDIAVLYVPLIHRERTIGVVYRESERTQEAFTPSCVSVTSILASQAAVSFESAQLFEALRKTNMWMVEGQQIGRMGSFRWNIRTLLSRASRECYRIFDINTDVNPVPFEEFRDRVHPDDLPALERGRRSAPSLHSTTSTGSSMKTDDLARRRGSILVRPATLNCKASSPTSPSERSQSKRWRMYGPNWREPRASHRSGNSQVRLFMRSISR
jgi:hypothetical protein